MARADTQGGPAAQPEPPLDRRGAHDGVPVGGRDRSGERVAAPPATGRVRIPLLEQVRAHERTSAFIAAADEFMAAQGFTEHGFRHAGLVGNIAFNVLTHLGNEPRTCELAAVAGYLHDVGNVVSRAYHGQTSAMLAFDLLKELGVDAVSMAQVMSAVGNHEEQYGVAVSPVAAAVILADKSDVHRSRVRKDASIDMDIHDRVNYAVEVSFLRVDPGARSLTLELTIDTSISHVLEYFEIFLERMIMCRRAARTLGCDFKIMVNGIQVL
ncbi:MAG TPA: HD domain-containing protein [Egibacteraceae bacterium]|nr:HD domain-containing protein [Actinomycetota bacterium]HWB71318.1 HD domain-containing protein [Egibacteraceae bacterium]